MPPSSTLPPAAASVGAGWPAAPPACHLALLQDLRSVSNWGFFAFCALCSHGLIIRKWAPGHEQVKAPPPCYTGRPERQTQNDKNNATLLVVLFLFFMALSLYDRCLSQSGQTSTY